MKSHRALRSLASPRVCGSILVAALAWHACLMEARAATPPLWKSTPYLLPQGDTTLEKIFADFRRLMNVPVDLTEGVQGPTASSGQTLPVDSFLDALANRHGLSWFVFRDRLYVSRQSEAREIRIKVAAQRMAEVRSYLLGIKLLDDRFTWVEIASRDEVMVQGPPAYVELVREIAGSVRPLEPPSPPPPPPPEKMQIMTFRLRYASAGGDGGRPGVVAILNSLYGDTLSGSVRTLSPNGVLDKTRVREAQLSESRAATAAASATSPDVRGAMARIAQELATGGAVKEERSPLPYEARPIGTSMPREEAPTFEADTRLNMVIIKDKPSRRPEYERVIAALDVMTEQIALDATIIELPVNSMRDALAAISANAAVARSASGLPALVVSRNVAERAFEQVSRARLKEGGAAILTQGLVFNEDDPFSVDFADTRSAPSPQYSTTIWETLAHSLVPMKIDPVGADSRMGIRLSGTAKYILGHGVNVKLDLSEDRSLPEKASRQSNARTTAASMSVELREDQVLVLVNSSVWGSEDINEPRARAVLLSAQRWQSQSQIQPQAQPQVQPQLQPPPPRAQTR